MIINNRTMKTVRPTFEVVPESKTVHKGKAVVCLDDGNIFRSAREAANYYGLTYTTVIYCCAGKTKTCGGGKGNYSGKGIKLCYVTDLAYRTDDIAKCIASMKEKADRAAAIEAQMKEFKEMFRKHQEETRAMMEMIG